MDDPVGVVVEDRAGAASGRRLPQGAPGRPREAARMSPPPSVGGHRHEGPGLKGGEHPVHGRGGDEGMVHGVEEDGVGPLGGRGVEADDRRPEHSALGSRVHHEGDVAGEVGVRGRLPGPVADDGHDAGHSRLPERPRDMGEEARAADAEQRLRAADATARSRREHHRDHPHEAH